MGRTIAKLIHSDWMHEYQTQHSLHSQTQWDVGWYKSLIVAKKKPKKSQAKLNLSLYVYCTLSYNIKLRWLLMNYNLYVHLKCVVTGVWWIIPAFDSRFWNLEEHRTNISKSSTLFTVRVNRSDITLKYIRPPPTENTSILSQYTIKYETPLSSRGKQSWHFTTKHI